MTETIVLLDPTTEERAEKIRHHLPPEFTFRHGSSRGEEHSKEIIAEADYAISGQVPVSGTVLRAAKRLKLLHKWGVGVDNLDIETARELGIKVARTTGSNAVPVAEFTLGLALAALRCIAHGHRQLHKGEWRTPSVPGETFMLSGKTVGIVGFGAVGQTWPSCCVASAVPSSTASVHRWPPRRRPHLARGTHPWRKFLRRRT